MEYIYIYKVHIRAFLHRPQQDLESLTFLKAMPVEFVDS